MGSMSLQDSNDNPYKTLTSSLRDNNCGERANRHAQAWMQGKGTDKMGKMMLHGLISKPALSANLSKPIPRRPKYTYIYK